MDSESVTLKVTQKDDAVTIEGVPQAPEDNTWRAELLDDRRILLRADEAPPLPQQHRDGRAAGTCPVGVFKDVLLALSAGSFSGLISVDTGYGLKRLFMEGGNIVFAGSNIIDDRLGEVLFREAKITLDQLTDSASQVTKSRKFGQLLISNGSLSNVELWRELKLQVRQILRSLFMTERLYFETSAGQGKAPTEVVFTETPADLIRDCYAYGCAFRSFLGRLRVESEAIFIMPREETEKLFAPGTFTGDLIALIAQESSIQALLNSSKLIDPYTVAALLGLVNHGICKIVPEVEDWRKLPPELAPLKSKLDAHTYVLQAVRRAFEAAKKDFPLAEARTFVAGLNPEGFPSVYIDEQAALGRDCVAGMINQCNGHPERVRHFVVRIESLIQFLLQVAGDNLEYQAAAAIRSDYRSVTL